MTTTRVDEDGPGWALLDLDEARLLRELGEQSAHATGLLDSPWAVADVMVLRAGHQVGPPPDEDPPGEPELAPCLFIALRGRLAFEVDGGRGALARGGVLYARDGARVRLEAEQDATVLQLTLRAP